MRVRRGVVLAFASLASGAALVACLDLFHSTSDVLTACELDASRAGCSAVSTKAVETDFCAASPEQAKQRALHACAWLGACEAPIGNNAFGPCYFRALMAFDCAVNPNHRARNTAHRLWDCLQRVRTCREVDACIFGDAGAPGCVAGDFTACLSDAGSPVRVACSDAHPRGRGENCALWGQTCAQGNGGALCAGSAQGLSCTLRQCNPPSSIDWCDTDADGSPGNDRGIDCASNGAATCANFPAGEPTQWAACMAETDAAAGPAECVPDASATCENGRAVSCPSGVPETLDCATLLNSSSACTPGPLDPPFDWTSPCALPVPECTSDSCGGADGDLLTSCERQANFSVSCSSEHLGPCQLVQGEPASPPRAACTPPAP